MQTDISLESDTDKIIIDAKYYKEALQSNRFGKQIIRRDHLSQLKEYLINLEAKGGVNKTCSGILLYSTVATELNDHYEASGHEISVRTINLNQNWKKIKTDLLELINI